MERIVALSMLPCDVHDVTSERVRRQASVAIYDAGRGQVVSTQANGGAIPPAPPLPGAASPDQSPGWIEPDAPDSKARGKPLLIGLLIVGALGVAGVLAATLMLDRGSSGPNVASIGFGTGGSECTLEGTASSFPLGVPVRAVLTLSASLPADGTVTVRLKRNGAELLDQRDTITFDEPASCVYTRSKQFDVGHYQMTFDVNPSAMPPISGEFDVTPADVASTRPSIGAPSSSPSPPLVALGDEVVVVDQTRAELGTVEVVEAREPAPSEIAGYLAAAGYRLIVVKVRYNATALWEINMFDWALHDEAGRQYDPAGFGPAPLIVSRKLAPGETFEGWVGFEVPRSANVWIDMLDLDRTITFSVEWKQ